MPERLFSQEQYDMLLRCSQKKDMTEWNEWREKNQDQEILLEGANLNGANLRGASLWGANLNKAKLWKADLEGADLEGDYLNGAILWKSNLSNTNLNDADLTGAILRLATLQKRTSREQISWTPTSRELNYQMQDSIKLIYRKPF